MAEATGPVIRPALAADLAQTGDLFDELDRFQSRWRVFTPRANLREEAERRYAAALEDPDALQVVAEQDGRLVGMALGRVEAISSISDERVLDVSNVVVIPAYRGRGIARQLILSLAAFARDRGAERLALKTYAENDQAMQLWVSMGFRPRWVQMTATVDELERRST